MDEAIDRRKYPRALIRVLVDYESQDTYIFDYSNNLSEGGIFIKTANPLKKGSVFMLKFSLPDVDKVFKIKGEVRWTNTKETKNVIKGMGIVFRDIDDGDRKLINQYIDGFLNKKGGKN